MTIKYARPASSNVVYADNLQYGNFYREANDTRPEPTVYIATDEGTVVSMDGVEYRRDSIAGGGYVEVQVDITVGGDL